MAADGFGRRWGGGGDGADVELLSVVKVGSAGSFFSGSGASSVG